MWVCRHGESPHIPVHNPAATTQTADPSPKEGSVARGPFLPLQQGPRPQAMPQPSLASTASPCPQFPRPLSATPRPCKAVGPSPLQPPPTCPWGRTARGLRVDTRMAWPRTRKRKQHINRGRKHAECLVTLHAPPLRNSVTPAPSSVWLCTVAAGSGRDAEVLPHTV